MRGQFGKVESSLAMPWCRDCGDAYPRGVIRGSLTMMSTSTLSKEQKVCVLVF
ncbi:hypothetical protein HMPREF9621_02887, partial [Cutibacterium modestum HL037PA2]